MIHFDAKHQKSETKTKVKEAKIKWKNRSETKIKQKKVKKSEKSEKNRLEFRFASKQKLLNRSEAKNLKRKKVKKMRKNASLCFASKRKLLKWSEATLPIGTNTILQYLDTPN